MERVLEEKWDVKGAKMSGDNGKIINPEGENPEGEQKLSQTDELRAFLRERLKDNLELADEIMHKMGGFVPMDELFLAAKNSEKGLATFVNPSLSVAEMDHAIAGLKRMVDQVIYAKQIKKQQSAIIQPKGQPKGGIMNFVRGKGMR